VIIVGYFVAVGVIAFILWLASLNTEENMNTYKKFVFKHIYGLPEFDCLADITITVTNSGITIQNAGYIGFQNISHISSYKRYVVSDTINIKNALLGGVVAGGAGTLIGSQTQKKKTTQEYYFAEISYTKNNINKIVVISDDCNKGYTRIGFLTDCIKSLAKNKEIDVILQAINYEDSEMYKQSQNKTNIVDNTVQNTINTTIKENNYDIIVNIEQLAKLRDNNILTEEEFNTKKQELLSRL
jgi:hypothetical protein